MKTRCSFLRLLIIAGSGFHPGISLAGSPEYPIAIGDGDQRNPAAVSHVAGSGAVIAWEDTRNGSADIYAQLLCGCDSASWDRNGVPISIASGDQRHPVLAADMEEGTVIAWEDGRNGAANIYAQLVDARGVVKWTGNGVALGASDYAQANPAITIDSSGGVVIAWEEKRGGSDTSGIYAQRIALDGTIKWGAQGVSVCPPQGAQSNPRILFASKGKVIVSWQDRRSGSDDIYAQGLDSSGALLWGAAGVGICTADSAQVRPRMIGDAQGGAILAWTDFRRGDADVFAQRIAPDGKPLWTDNGIDLDGAAKNAQDGPVLDRDGEGGAIVVWTDKRDGAGKIYGQRLSGAGMPLWSSAGVPLGAGSGEQSDPQIVRSYRGDASVAWAEKRDSATNVQLQVITAGGLIQYGETGRLVAGSNADQSNPVLVSDGNIGVIAIWQDARNGNADIFSEMIPGEEFTAIRNPGGKGTPRDRYRLAIGRSAELGNVVTVNGMQFPAGTAKRGAVSPYGAFFTRGKR